MPDTLISKRELNGAEALMGFLSWLSIRQQPVTFSAHHSPAIAIELLDQFSAAHPVGTLGPDWPHCLTPMPESATTNEAQESFKTQLTRLINHHSLEGGSDTPDFLLADYLVQCLAVFDVTITHREAWHRRPLPNTPACLEEVADRRNDEGIC